MTLDLENVDLATWISRRAQEHPDHPAIVHGDRQLSYGELEDAIARFSEALQGLGLRRGDSLAMLLPNCPEFVIAFMAAMRLGVMAIPMNPQFRETEIEQYLDDARPRVIIAAQPLAGMVNQVLTNRSFVDRILIGVPNGDGPWYRFDELIEVHRPRTTLDPVPPDTAALCMYSSGSTGGSKRVVRTQSHLAAEARAMHAAAAISPADRVLCAVPMSHAHGLGNGILGALYGGATLVSMDGFDRRQVLERLDADAITVFPAVPFMIRVLSQTSLKREVDLSGLRLCFSAGAPLAEETYRAFRERYGIPVRQLYGSTETGAVSINLSDDADASWASVGAPLAGVEFAVFDDAGANVGVEVDGRVGIRSPAMFTGYLDRPDLTDESFVDGYFFAGDRGRLDANGRLFLTGRDTLFVNLGGNKVNPADVETLLLTHPQVDEVVVVGSPAPGGGEQVKAVVVSKDPPSPAELIEFCRGKIADYKVPRVVEIRDEIPRSPLGKVLRKYLL